MDLLGLLVKLINNFLFFLNIEKFKNKKLIKLNILLYYTNYLQY